MPNVSSTVRGRRHRGSTPPPPQLPQSQPPHQRPAAVDQARQARRALAEARSATLLMPGGADCHDSVLLFEHDGTPILISERNSRVAVAAWAEEHVLLTVAATEHDTAQFAGRLILADVGTSVASHCSSDNVAIVELELASVRIGTAAGLADCSVAPLPLGLYFAAIGAP